MEGQSRAGQDWAPQASGVTMERFLIGTFATLEGETLDVDAAAVVATAGSLLDESVLAPILSPRRANSHKGTFGSLGIVGGAAGMVGASVPTPASTVGRRWRPT